MKNSSFFTSFIFLLLSILSLSGQVRKVMIFDLNGVLLKVPRGKVGFKAYMKKGSIFHIDEMKDAKRPLFAVLDQIGTKYEHPACDSDGMALPAGLCELQAGTICCADLVATANAIIDRELARGSIFINRFQAEFVREIIKITFDPQQFVTFVEPLRNGVKFLKAVARDPEVALMILSNFEAEQFALCTQKKSLQPIFTTIPSQNWIVSGMFKSHLYTKPHPFLFDYVVTLCQQRWGVSAADIIFLDDQQENVNAASRCGIDAYQVKDEDKSFTCIATAVCKKHTRKRLKL